MVQYVAAVLKSAIGRADVVVKMKDAIYVFEFKFDGTPEEALTQIDSKQYAIPYQSDGWQFVKVGVNLDSATRTIGGWKIVNIWLSSKCKKSIYCRQEVRSLSTKS